MTTNVIITFTLKPEKRASFVEILKSVKNELPKAEGCNGVRIFNNEENENVFTLLENWDSQELHQKHIAGVIESGGWEAIAGHLATDPESAYFSEST